MPDPRPLRKLTEQRADELVARFSASWTTGRLSSELSRAANFSEPMSRTDEPSSTQGELAGQMSGTVEDQKRPSEAVTEGEPKASAAVALLPKPETEEISRSSKSVETSVPPADIEEIPSRRALARRDTLPPKSLKIATAKRPWVLRVGLFLALGALAGLGLVKLIAPTWLR